MSKALLKNIRLSPIKARLIASKVQGMNAEYAIASLEFTPNKAARIISKVIASAVANGSYEASNVEVLLCRVDAGSVYRRFTPRARGRATPIRKPTSHIFVEVGTLSAKTTENKSSSSKGVKISAKKETKVGKVKQAITKKEGEDK